MAKFTLFFKDTIVEVFHLSEDETVTIGRDSSNTFTIDSLAIAPTHLTVSFEGNKYFIENTSDQFPSYIEGKPVKKQPLQQGDKIRLAKHELLFTDDVADFINIPKKEEKAPKRSITTANLQLMNGADIGKVITLSSALTEIKQGNTVPAIIAKRQSGYYISKLIDDIEIYINDVLADNEAKLEQNVKFRIDNQKYIFFTE